jgi:hypothetical protein
MGDESPPSTDDAEPAPEAIRGEVRLAGHRRVSHGLFLPLRSGLSSKDEFLRDLRAWQRVLPEGTVFTHITGAKLRGWPLPKLPEQVPVFAAAEGDPARPQRPGLIFSRLVRAAEPDLSDGIPVDKPEEILLRAARDFGLLDLVILVDSARRAGDIDERRMQNVLATSRPGVRMLRMAWSLSDARADSAGETILRLFHVVIEVPVEPQAELIGEEGQVIGHADLLIVGTRELQEYDGECHRDHRQHRKDLRRERGLSGSSYHRHGYVLDDLLNFPATLMHEIDRMLGRPHRMARVRRWQRLVQNSMYAETGRERVLNRWRRVNGIIDWSKPA